MTEVADSRGPAGRDVTVDVDSVTKTYHIGEPVRALDGVSLALPRGSYTAVMGPGGSRKSTLMNLVGRLDTPTGGRITVNSSDVTALSDRERTRSRGEEIGFVFQTFNLMSRLTALENVTLPMVAREWHGRSEPNARGGSSNGSG